MRSADVRKFISQRVYNEQPESEPEQEPEPKSKQDSEPESEPESEQTKQSAEQIIIGGCRLTAPYI
jgi:hypothetical protein